MFALGLLQFAAAQDKPSPARRFAELQANLAKEVAEQLRSDDLIMVAWGAHAAGEFRLDQCVPDLRAGLAALERLEPKERQFAALAILDALIQRNAVVPGERLQPFLDGWCMQPALVLLGRRGNANRKILLDIFRRLRPTAGPGWRTCGNLLADAEDPEFVLELLRTPVNLTVHVTTGAAEPALDGRQGGSAFWTSLISVPEGYPPTALYEILEGGTDAVLLASGPVSTYVRRVAHRGRTIHHCVSGSVDADELRRTSRAATAPWLAKMLGPDARSPPRSPQFHVHAPS